MQQFLTKAFSLFCILIVPEQHKTVCQTRFFNVTITRPDLTQPSSEQEQSVTGSPWPNVIANSPYQTSQNLRPAAPLIPGLSEPENYDGADYNGRAAFHPVHFPAITATETAGYPAAANIGIPKTATLTTRHAAYETVAPVDYYLPQRYFLPADQRDNQGIFFIDYPADVPAPHNEYPPSQQAYTFRHPVAGRQSNNGANKAVTTTTSITTTTQDGVVAARTLHPHFGRGVNNNLFKGALQPAAPKKTHSSKFYKDSPERSSTNFNRRYSRSVNVSRQKTRKDALNASTRGNVQPSQFVPFFRKQDGIPSPISTDTSRTTSQEYTTTTPPGPNPLLVTLAPEPRDRATAKDNTRTFQFAERFFPTTTSQSPHYTQPPVPPYEQTDNLFRWQPLWTDSEENDNEFLHSNDEQRPPVAPISDSANPAPSQVSEFQQVPIDIPSEHVQDSSLIPPPPPPPPVQQLDRASQPVDLQTQLQQAISQKKEKVPVNHEASNEDKDEAEPVIQEQPLPSQESQVVRDSSLIPPPPPPPPVQQFGRASQPVDLQTQLQQALSLKGKKNPRMSRTAQQFLSAQRDPFRSSGSGSQQVMADEYLHHAKNSEPTIDSRLPPSSFYPSANESSGSDKDSSAFQGSSLIPPPPPPPPPVQQFSSASQPVDLQTQLQQAISQKKEKVPVNHGASNEDKDEAEPVVQDVVIEQPSPSQESQVVQDSSVIPPPPPPPPKNPKTNTKVVDAVIGKDQPAKNELNTKIPSEGKGNLLQDIRNFSKDKLKNVEQQGSSKEEKTQSKGGLLGDMQNFDKSNLKKVEHQGPSEEEKTQAKGSLLGEIQNFDKSKLKKMEQQPTPVKIESKPTTLADQIAKSVVNKFANVQDDETDDEDEDSDWD